MSEITVSLIGLEDLAARVNDICAHAEMFRRGGLTPDHFIVNLDAGNGQTTVAAFVSEMFSAHHIRPFGGLDMFLEYRLDGTMEQLRDVLADIRACAVYTNDYEGVIAMDVAGLAARVGEAQTALFLEQIAAIGEHATFVFFVPSVIRQNTAALIKKICAALKNVEVIHAKPYTCEHLAGILKKMLAESGIALEGGDMDECLAQIVRDADALSVPDIRQLARSLVRCADYALPVPRLSAHMLRAACAAPGGARTEVK